MGKHINDHLDTLDSLDALLDSMKGQGYSINEINQTIIGRCLIEMNGILACIADNLEKESTVNEDKIVKSYDLLCCDKGTYFRFYYNDYTWEYSDFIISDYQIKYDCDGYSSEEALIAYILSEYKAKTVDEYKAALKKNDFDIEPFNYKKEIRQNGEVQ